MQIATLSIVIINLFMILGLVGAVSELKRTRRIQTLDELPMPDFEDIKPKKLPRTKKAVKKTTTLRKQR